MSKQHWLTAAGPIFAILTLIAIGRQLVIHVESGFSVINFFSYFTNLSNLFAALVLLRFTGLSVARRQPSTTDELLRGMAVVYMTIVGLVFSILLRDVDLGTLRPWVNVVVHYVMPVVLLVDWLVQPGSAFTDGRNWVLAQVVPLLYLGYVLARGAIVDWYPYPFLNPQRGGYGSVALYVIMIMLLFIVTLWAVNATSRVLRRPVDTPTRH